MQDALVHCLGERQNIVINVAIIASNICWDSKISPQYCPLTFIPMLDKNNFRFWHSDWHSDRLSKHQAWCWHTAGCYAPFLGSVWCIQSIVLAVKRGSTVAKRLILTCFVCFGEKRAAFKWKHAVSWFPVSPDSAEALVTWGGKIKYLLIAYFQWSQSWERKRVYGGKNLWNG